MRRPITTVHRWVTESLRRIIEEPARDVLKMELQRLDEIQSAIFANAAEGDPTSIKLYLDVSHRRCMLLGLFPKEPTINLNMPADPKPLQVTFVLPSKPQDPPPIIDAGLQPQPDYSLPAIEGPRPRQRTDFGIVEQPRHQDYRPEFPGCQSQRGEPPPSALIAAQKTGG
jgi:hypothetical protein